MTTQPQKRQKLRNAEYYNLQAEFDRLYADSCSDKTFRHLMGLIASENNIRLAYRNIKRNSGSTTAGTDGKTIRHLEKWKTENLIAHVKTAVMVYAAGDPARGNPEGQRQEPPAGNTHDYGQADSAGGPASAGTDLRGQIP